MVDFQRPAATWVIPLLFGVFYALWPILGLPQFFYAPEHRDVSWSRPTNAIVMGWYGQLTMSAVAAIFAGGILARLADRRPKPWHRLGPWLAVLGVTAGLVITAVREILRWML